MRFRPCIDLKNGKVVQIVGGTLDDADDKKTDTNFTAENPSDYYARLYKKDALVGGHVIALGQGNKEAALTALAAYQGGMQYGGGVNDTNAKEFLEAGASHVIMTSYVFRDGKLEEDRLKGVVSQIGIEKLVLDLSCRKRDGKYWVVTDRWQKFSELVVDAKTLESLSMHCAEFLVHGVDVEGKMAGIEEELVALLGEHSPIPVTYAGGAQSLEDLERVKSIGNGRVDLTIGSALDIFGGSTAYKKVVAWDKIQDD
ncbi:phosphoribosylformimino-5-aminoimidazole carboxamide ribotide isomerase [Puniceicoccaceae bacterium K14]|nr:phosphoribosylformimino-5-aminoimidazole carboxamide ribotide isomerase [Puniceicoccaceae bacterium K14]